jgi:hypothetical protein
VHARTQTGVSTVDMNQTSVRQTHLQKCSIKAIMYMLVVEA